MLLANRHWTRACTQLLVQAGCICIASSTGVLAQVAPAAQLNGAAAQVQLPPDVQSNLNRLQTELKAAQSSGDTAREAKLLNDIGASYTSVSQYQNALDAYNQALTRARAATDRRLETAALNGVAGSFRAQSRNDEARRTYQQALAVAIDSADLTGQATALAGIGEINRSTGHAQTALGLYNRALVLARKAADAGLEATILRLSGAVLRELGESQKALDSLNRALPIFRATGDRDGEAATLHIIAAVYLDLSEFQKVLDSESQALPIFRATGNQDREADALTNIGSAYSGLGAPQKGLENYDQALAIYRKIGDRDGEAAVLQNIGNAYGDLGTLQKALESYNQALPIFSTVGDRNSEAQTLTDIGLVYADLGKPKTALDNYNQALPIFRAAGDREHEADTLNDMALAYGDLHESRKALDSLNRTLPIYRATRDRDHMAIALINIGRAYDDLHKTQQALYDFNRALPIFRAARDRQGEGTTLTCIGDVYRRLGDSENARENYNQALPLATAVNNPLLTARVFYSMMRNEKNERPLLAAFYGKEAVNLLQQIRGNIRDLEKDLQKSFLGAKENYYHDLADLLIDQGRLPEAQQVLDLLKEQEYLDFVRGDQARVLGPLSLTPAEKEAENAYQSSTAQIVSLGEQFLVLKNVSSRTSEQEQRYQQLSDSIQKASRGLNDYYARLYKLLGKGSSANLQVAEVSGEVSLLRQQIAMMPHTVALYTVVSSDRYRVIVITGATAVAREYPITEKNLNQKVSAFQQVLRDPLKNPKPLAQELYKILIGPINADLDQMQAQTLVWSLQGVLRYIPMAVLHNGTHYLIENYKIVTLTPASIPHLAKIPALDQASAVAMGISRAYENGLTPLPQVKDELDRIVHDSQAPDAKGVLPGTILLNEQFTEKAMEGQLDGGRAIVHIASHFVFSPGDADESWLLLAGKDRDSTGYHLTVAEFRDDPKLALDNTALLTLSACETGMGGAAADGREVDGLAMTAHQKGAAAVISSLWSVHDASTGELMADFYRRWTDGKGTVMKVEALREAQMDLLNGTIGPKPNFADPDAPTSYAHPYYWAPFVLTGNWR